MHTYISQHKNSAYFVFILLFILFFICMSGRICMPYKYHSISFSFILRRSTARGESQMTINFIYTLPINCIPGSQTHLTTWTPERGEGSNTSMCQYRFQCFVENLHESSLPSLSQFAYSHEVYGSLSRRKDS